MGKLIEIDRLYNARKIIANGNIISFILLVFFHMVITSMIIFLTTMITLLILTLRIQQLKKQIRHDWEIKRNKYGDKSEYIM